MLQQYQEHRAAFLDVLSDALAKYRGDVSAGLSSGTELMTSFESALSGKGTVRLFKYQPFSERNLQDCQSGVLHLTKLADLNDVNEGRLIFDTTQLEHALSTVDVNLASSIAQQGLPSFVKDHLGDAGLEEFGKKIKQAQEVGDLEKTIAPSIASTLRAISEQKRDVELCGSLSATERSASMWDRYGNEHRGFVAGYTLEIFTADLTTSRSGSCMYGFKTLIAPVYYGERFDVSFYSSAASIHDPSLIGGSNMDVLYLALSTLQKAKEWEYEQEWRVISYACRPDARVHYCRLKPDSIYLGFRMQEDERARAIEVARRNGWTVYEMKLSEDSVDWTLEVKELADG